MPRPIAVDRERERERDADMNALDWCFIDLSSAMEIWHSSDLFQMEWQDVS